MMGTTLISSRFISLQEFEKFALDWSSICYKLNKSDRNKSEVERWRKVVEARQNEAK
ncbi:hypothetical protein [Claveliimonas bilis]|uniref:hypothetical protein n=1 Tax=Claveliimonas bilis TaxID=3028070 RepID=UPI00292F678D|nr:hypothetical protein [Claveliimonas bilis]BDZ80498.1 hypothetical protein Lac3_17070 [Claveliimonas bilis]